MSGLNAGLAALESRLQLNDKAQQQQLHNLQRFAVHAVDELHRVISDLRPNLLDELGLVAALRWHARHYGESLPTAVAVEVDGRMRRLPQEIEIVLFRIAQEALTNVVRHARANTATIRLTMEERRAILEVEDDGIGFDLDKTYATTGEHRPWGLLGMQERASLAGGTVEIQSKSWQGTKLTVIIPLPPEEAPAETIEATVMEMEPDARPVG